MSRDSNNRWRAANRQKWLELNRANYRKHSEERIAMQLARRHLIIDGVAALADREAELAGMAEILFGGIEKCR
jgi:hypothetical protein